MRTRTQRMAARIGRPVLAVLCLLAAGAAQATAQVPSGARPTTSDTAVSATMLRVLAEAADQFRTGRPIFLVADHRFPYNVSGPFASFEEANRVRADSGSTFGVFGPYVTPADPVDSVQVVKVRVTVRTPRGQREFDVDPKNIDALFFSNSAVHKFLLPYYTSIYGPEYALKLAQLLLPKKPPGHCLSRACYPDPFEYVHIWDPMAGPPVLGLPAGGPPR